MGNQLIHTRLALLLLTYLLIFGSGHAQQRPLYSQYMFNGLFINPAYAGADEALSVTLSSRSQWSGLDGAPETFAFASHVLLDRQRIGLGLAATSDKIGVHRNLLVNGSMAYHLRISARGTLSFGLQAGVRNHKADYLSLTGNQPYDPRVAATAPGRTFFDMGTGAYFRNERFEAGISVPGLFRSDWSATDSAVFRSGNTHGLFFSKYSIPVTPFLDVIPSLFVQYYPGVPVCVDVSGGVLVHKVLFTGIAYRRNESVDFLLRASVTPQLSIGYSYDVTVGEVSALSNASHEVTVNYLFKFSRHKIADPR